MEYSIDQVIKMMEAYANAVADMAIHETYHCPSHHGKEKFISHTIAQASFELFEEEVPEEIRNNLVTKRKDLEETLKFSFGKEINSD